MAFQAGTWQIDANGTSGILEIHDVDTQGNVTGTVFGNPITGIWDDAAQRLNFVRVPDPNDPRSYQAYVGYAFDDEESAGVTFLTGSFEVFGDVAGGTQNKPTFGWFASNSTGPALSPA